MYILFIILPHHLYSVSNSVTFDQVEFTDTGLLSRNSEFIIAARGIKEGVNSLFSWLEKYSSKNDPLSMSYECLMFHVLPLMMGFRVEEWIRVEWTCHVKPDPPHRGDHDSLRNTSFTKTMKVYFWTAQQKESCF